MKTQLLCTFTTQFNLDQSIIDITKNFKIVFDKIYVLQNEDKPKELICTYNVNQEDDIDFNLVQNTISEMNGKNVLIILGGQKVPGEVYDIADYNIAVTGQPHSEIAALAVFLDRYSGGEALETEFPDANISVKPSERGKDIVRK